MGLGLRGWGVEWAYHSTIPRSVMEGGELLSDPGVKSKRLYCEASGSDDGT